MGKEQYEPTDALPKAENSQIAEFVIMRVDQFPIYCFAQLWHGFYLLCLYPDQKCTDHLKCHYDENRIFSIEAILKHKQVACMRRKMLFTIFKCLFVQEIFKFFKICKLAK